VHDQTCDDEREHRGNGGVDETGGECAPATLPGVTDLSSEIVHTECLEVEDGRRDDSIEAMMSL